MQRGALVLSLWWLGCGGGGGGAQAIDSGSNVAHDGATADAAADALTFDAIKASACASTFGSDMTAGFGRADGTILAVVPPGDEACAMPNSTHLVVQVTLEGAAYRLVVDVRSDQGSPDVWFHELDAPLVGSAWSDGWHVPASLDYVNDLAVHSTAFTEMTEGELVGTITSELQIGAHVSIFATAGSDEPDSAHLVHRNVTGQDGAIVIAPDTAPHYLLMRFDEQTF